MSHHPSEIILICWFAVQEIWFIIININVDSSCAAYYFCGSHDIFFQDSLINRKFKIKAFQYIYFFLILYILLLPLLINLMHQCWIKIWFFFQKQTNTAPKLLNSDVYMSTVWDVVEISSETLSLDIRSEKLVSGRSSFNLFSLLERSLRC